ncbi:MAG: rhomboid family intramembrane serine protease [Desulfovibrio sp.]|nr:rhomboid family intramembrane serine protease [Desulfovibrio sp.]
MRRQRVLQPVVPRPNLCRKMRRRPIGLCPFWRDITAPTGFLSYTQRRDWLLVLSSRRIPYTLIKFRGREHLYVPPMAEKLALTELAEYADERVPASLAAPLHGGSVYAALFLLPLIVWHAMRFAWMPAPDFLPPPSFWLDAGVLDTIKVRVYGQWWRTATALTLHADTFHLLSNVAFGALFLPLLARLAGMGRAVWLTILGGVMGNALTVCLHTTGVVRSLGFSTALFATIGGMAGFMACRQEERRKIILPIAAAAGLLAVLGTGTEGDQTDYAAHVAGLICGFFFGAVEALRFKYGHSRQILALLLALLLPVLAWRLAFIAQ